MLSQPIFMSSTDSLCNLSATLTERQCIDIGEMPVNTAFKGCFKGVFHRSADRKEHLLVRQETGA
jgi:hypothetical protein